MNSAETLHQAEAVARSLTHDRYLWLCFRFLFFLIILMYMNSILRFGNHYYVDREHLAMIMSQHVFMVRVGMVLAHLWR